MSQVARKPVVEISDHVRHKSGCTATDDGNTVTLKFCIWKLEELYYLGSKQSKALISLRGGAAGHCFSHSEEEVFS